MHHIIGVRNIYNDGFPFSSIRVRLAVNWNSPYLTICWPSMLRLCAEVAVTIKESRHTMHITIRCLLKMNLLQDARPRNRSFACPGYTNSIQSMPPMHAPCWLRHKRRTWHKRLSLSGEQYYHSFFAFLSLNAQVKRLDVLHFFI